MNRDQDLQVSNDFFPKSAINNRDSRGKICEAFSMIPAFVFEYRLIQASFPMLRLGYLSIKQLLEHPNVQQRSTGENKTLTITTANKIDM